MAASKDTTWRFSSTDNGEEKGLNDIGVEFFKGRASLAREVLQNVIDAAADQNIPVEATFELLHIPIDRLPGVTEFQDVLAKCADYCLGGRKEGREWRDKGGQTFNDARALLRGKTVPVLKISDSKTTGLSGDDQERGSPWYRLLRAQGSSQSSGPGGGSFGIGQRAPFAYSGLRTVFYSTKTDNRCAFIGKAILSSHETDGDLKQPVGYWGRLITKNERQSITPLTDEREIAALGPEFVRHEKGTDLFIVGFNRLDNWEEGIIIPIITNFYAALHANKIKVRIKGKTETLIDHDTLRDIFTCKAAEARDPEDRKLCGETLHHYLAISDSAAQTFTSAELKHLGKIALHVYEAKDAPRTIAFMRKPRSVVSISNARQKLTDRAAVLICENDRGNELLRILEDPSHTSWDLNRDSNGRAALKEMNDFIKECLNKIYTLDPETVHDIDNLWNYLPSVDEVEDNGAAAYGPPKKSFERISPSETGSETTKSKETRRLRIQVRPTTPPPLPAQIESAIDATSGGLDEGLQTEKLGDGESSGEPPSTTATGGGSLPGSASTTGGAGDAKIAASSLTFRSFIDQQAGDHFYRLVVSGIRDCKGTLELGARGEDATVYPVQITAASDFETGETISFRDSRLENLSFAKSKRRTFLVRIPSFSKLLLTVK